MICPKQLSKWPLEMSYPNELSKLRPGINCHLQPDFLVIFQDSVSSLSGVRGEFFKWCYKWCLQKSSPNDLSNLRPGTTISKPTILEYIRSLSIEVVQHLGVWHSGVSFSCQESVRSLLFGILSFECRSFKSPSGDIQELFGGHSALQIIDHWWQDPANDST